MIFGISIVNLCKKTLLQISFCEELHISFKAPFIQLNLNWISILYSKILLGINLKLYNRFSISYLQLIETEINHFQVYRPIVQQILLLVDILGQKFKSIGETVLTLLTLTLKGLGTEEELILTLPHQRLSQHFTLTMFIVTIVFYSYS